MRVTAKTTGDERVARGLRGLARRAATLGIESVDDVTPVISAGWLRSLRHQGPGWPPLKPSTVRTRIADGYAPGPMLVRSGRLERALGHPVAAASPESQEFSVRVSYAAAVLGKRPIKLDRVAVLATTRALSRSLHDGYRGIT